MTRAVLFFIALIMVTPVKAQIRNDAAMAIEALGSVAAIPGPGLNDQSTGVAIGGGLALQIVTIPQLEKGLTLGTPIVIQGDSRRRGYLPFVASPEASEIMFEIGQLRISAKPDGSFYRDLGGGLGQITATMLGSVIEDRSGAPNWKGVQVVMNVTCEGDSGISSKPRCAIGAKFRAAPRPRPAARNSTVLEVLAGQVRDARVVPAGNLEAGTHTLVLPADMSVSALPRGMAKDVFIAQPLSAALPPGMSHMALAVATQDVLMPSVTLHLGSLALVFTRSELVTLTATGIGKPGELNLRLLGKVEDDKAEDGDRWNGSPAVLTIACKQSGAAAPLICEVGITVSTAP